VGRRLPAGKLAGVRQRTIRLTTGPWLSNAFERFLAHLLWPVGHRTLHVARLARPNAKVALVAEQNSAGEAWYACGSWAETHSSIPPSLLRRRCRRAWWTG